MVAVAPHRVYAAMKQAKDRLLRRPVIVPPMPPWTLQQLRAAIRQPWLSGS
jgi:hypothetical protein